MKKLRLSKTGLKFATFYLFLFAISLVKMGFCSAKNTLIEWCGLEFRFLHMLSLGIIEEIAEFNYFSVPSINKNLIEFNFSELSFIIFIGLVNVIIWYFLGVTFGKKIHKKT